MPSRKLPTANLTIPDLLDLTTTILDSLTATFAVGTLPEQAQPAHAAKITRRAQSLRRAIVDLQAAYERIVRRAAGDV